MTPILSPDAQAVVRALEALTTQVRRAVDARQSDFALTPDATDARATPATTGTGAPRVPCPDCSGAPLFRPDEITDHIVQQHTAEQPTPSTDEVEQRAAGEEQTLRFLRRESLLVLLTRLQRGRTLTADEARRLREHVETEMREAETAREDRQRLGLMVDEYSAGARHLGDTLRTEKERADAAIERETVLEGEIEAQEAAIERVRAEAADWRSNSKAWGPYAAARVDAVLDGPEQPTTTEA